ncbi:MAG: DUF5615 family PIN-like protein [Candidatus Schekmanbacteria bacterium]|nr:DUF5615 family PIN-like protein [Candidatus Schekmanbacteria bacterium]
MNWREHIAVDPSVCHGKPCVAGTRVMVSVILDNLGVGQSVDDILAAYPTVTAEAVRATLAYAKVDEHLPVQCVGQLRAAGHDALAVQDQGLTGAADPRIAEVCAAERRVLFTRSVSSDVLANNGM